MQQSERSCSVRPANVSDAAALVVVILRAFEEYRGKIQPPSGAHAETAASIAALMEGGERAFIAEAHTGAAIGCVFYRPHPQYADVIYLHRLAVVPEARAQGVAGALMDAVEEMTRAEGRDYVWLGVRIALPANRAYYQKRGYLPIAYAAHSGFAQPTYVTMQRRVTPPIPRQVLLEEWNPRWSSYYDSAANEVRTLFGENLREVHHIGSTSIPGMIAKPTIDLLVIVDDLAQVDRTEPRVILSGWQPRGENGIPGRRYFRKGSESHHTHHLHVYTNENPKVRQHLAFIAWLCAHPEDAQRYADLKRQLAQQYPWDPGTYAAAKSDLVEEILQRALAAYPA